MESNPILPSTPHPVYAVMASDVVLEDGEFAAMFKIVLLGHSGVGKTSLLQKFTTRKFSGSLTTTVGIYMISSS